MTVTVSIPSPAADTAMDVYFKPVVGEGPRMLGLMDREAFSPTYGCMDRTYWAWKFTDFPGARFQEGLCALSFLYSTGCNQNPYHNNPRLLTWITAGIDFWTKRQRKAGDFDEAYPFERSLAATAFTSFYLSEAWDLLTGHLPQSSADRFRVALHRAAHWLVKNDETHGFLSNHLAAASAALYNAYRICGESRFERRAQYFLERILNHQSAEGWYEEYGGADPGYQTHGSFYLVRCLQLSGDSQLANSLERSFAFLAHFVHPDGSLGGEYASRNTKTYYPAAFEMMAEVSGTASWIAERMLPSVQTLAAAGLGSVDAYNYFPLLNNMVFAYRARAQRAARLANPQPPDQQPGVTHFPEAGIAKIRKAKYELYAGLTKGGVIKAFDRDTRQLVYNDCGYMGRIGKERLITTQWLDRGWRTQVSDEEVIVEGCFWAIKKPVMNPFSFLAFRLFSLSMGRVSRLARWLKRVLVSVLIYKRAALDIQFCRRIALRDNGFTVHDEISSSRTTNVRQLQWVDTFTTIHMGSSRYFVPNELQPLLVAASDETSELDPRRLAEGITVERSVQMG